MSVLFIYINAWSSTGGLQKFNRNFLTALDEIAGEGEKIIALSLHDAPSDFPADTRVQMHSAGGSRLRFILKAMQLGLACCKIIVGHVNVLFPVAFLLPKPIILITHGIEIWRPLSFLKKKSLHTLTEIVTVSTFTASKIESLFPYLKDRIRLLPNTIDRDFEQKSLQADPAFIQRTWNLPETAKIILTVCRLSSGEGEKGYDKVLACIPELAAKIPDVCYVLAGKYDAAEKERLDHIIKQAGIHDRVMFTGYVSDEDLPSIYASCDVFIMPSKKEGFGIVFLEALMLGRTVIGGNKDGTCDALLQGETGMLIDPDSSEEISAALESVLTGNIEKKPAPDFLRNKSLEMYGFKKYTERVRILVKK